MGDATKILKALQNGDDRAIDQLFSVVYDELRAMASRRMNAELPGQTLQATALVNEAYLRLVNFDTHSKWDHRGHFFSAATKAMDQIIVDRVRRKHAKKRGGGWGSDGDWNADGVFNSGDLVAAFQDGGYERGPRPSVRAVPEPHFAVALFVSGIACLLATRRRTRCDTAGGFSFCYEHRSDS